MATGARLGGATWVGRRFGVAERGTTVRIELLGGLATFLAMSYILFVNPAILSAAGMPFEAVAVATAIVSALATLAMALATNLPFEWTLRPSDEISPLKSIRPASPDEASIRPVEATSTCSTS